MEVTKLLFAEWKLLTIPLTAYLVFSKLPGFVEFLDRRKEIKQRREREEAERKKREEKDKWQDLIATIGVHKSLAKNVSEGDPLRFPEDFEKQRSQIIRALEGYKFASPSKKDLLAEDFDKCWYKFLEEGFCDVARLDCTLTKPPRKRSF